MVGDHASESLEAAKVGETALYETSQQMDSINHSVQHLAKIIEQLTDKSSEIGNIIQLITGITEQTNLLALNAAIEAARAGEHGKGFAVVADEVRKLAEESKKSAHHISILVSDIQQGTKEASTAMNKGLTEVKDGIHSVEKTATSLKQIVASAEDVTIQIQEVSAVSQQISAGTEQLSVTTKDMTEISKSTNQFAGHMIQLSNEQLQFVEEIESVSDQLTKMSKELDELIHQFKE
ncbi:methyl-accepting chemotaxis protein [Bacillus sp. AK128]